MYTIPDVPGPGSTLSVPPGADVPVLLTITTKRCPASYVAFIRVTLQVFFAAGVVGQNELQFTVATLVNVCIQLAGPARQWHEPLSMLSGTMLDLTSEVVGAHYFSSLMPTGAADETVGAPSFAVPPIWSLKGA
ncbi:hypothetical protein E2C01_067748 [Portunus trituberculatus]|uniref:Uncharacterized protein n=1 Tax=Portunus trituberculatus TaxID=210409 RepID=A0A5B7HLW0_PORTR|nr:hypothetical protein [Portunus trituberculatus]